MSQHTTSDLTLRIPPSVWKGLALGAALLISVPLLVIGAGLFSVKNAIKPGETPLGRNANGGHGLHRCGTPPPISSDRRSHVYSSSGRFLADVCINSYGQSVAITHTQERSVLTWNDAVEFHLKPNRLTFDQTYTTSFGTIRVAATKVPVVSVGDIQVPDIEVFVALEHSLAKSFLGKDFLGKLKSYKYIDASTLLMIPK